MFKSIAPGTWKNFEMIAPRPLLLGSLWYGGRGQSVLEERVKPRLSSPPGHLPGHARDGCETYSVSSSLFKAALLGACVGSFRRRGAGRAAVVALASNKAESNPSGVKCGDKLQASVIRILKIGLLLCTGDGTQVFIPQLALQRAKEDYIIDEKLEVTVTQLPIPGNSSNDLRSIALKATDKPLRPLSSVPIGALVDGLVRCISDHGVLFDISVHKNAYANWRNLEPLGLDRAELKPGDTISGLKVRGFRKANVEVGAASLDVRKLSELKVGEEVRGVVVNIVSRINAVFFDIGATHDAAALGRKGHLSKPISNYTRGEEACLEILRAAQGQISVKDLGFRDD